MNRDTAFRAGAPPLPQAACAPPGAARPAVLVASTTWWAFPARIAMECAARGLQVDAICGPGHPLLKTAAVRRSFAYGAASPLRALRHAIGRSSATLVVPCDDRVRADLHLLHARTADPDLRRVIENSLGDASSFPILQDRSALIACARDLGIAAPETLPVATAAGLDLALDRLGLPAVLKVDGTWGGLGVCVVRTRPEAQLAFARMSRPLSFGRAAKRALVDRDRFSLRPWVGHDTPRLCLQRFAWGQPANSISACRDGEILGTICAEAVVLQRPHGASSVVRIIEHAQMAGAAVKLAHHLKLSGLFGLDFLIDGRTGEAQLVEMNARATPLAHLALGAGRDLMGALGQIAGLPQAPDPRAVTGSDVIAYFPQAWHAAPESPWLRQAFHDVPWEDPALLAELLKQPRPDRGLLATALRALRRAPAEAGAPPAPCMMDVT